MSTLTAQMIEDAAQNLTASFGTPDTYFVPAGFCEELLVWQKREKWIMSLPKRQQKQIRLRDRLLSRKPYKKVNLPK